MWSMENVEYGKCGVWKMRSMENVEYGKCGVWKMTNMENAEYGKCGVCGNASTLTDLFISNRFNAFIQHKKNA